MPRESIYDELVSLMRERHRLNMPQMLERLAWLHCRSGANGYKLAHRGYYRDALEALITSPRSLQRRVDAAVCFYLVALYVEQFQGPKVAGVHFATAYRELYGAVELRQERYGEAWTYFTDFHEERAFFDAITAMTGIEQRNQTSLFYKRPYLLPGMLTQGNDETLPRPFQMPQNWLGRLFRSLLPAPGSRPS